MGEDVLGGNDIGEFGEFLVLMPVGDFYWYSFAFGEFSNVLGRVYT